MRGLVSVAVMAWLAAASGCGERFEPGSGGAAGSGAAPTGSKGDGGEAGRGEAGRAAGGSAGVGGQAGHGAQGGTGGGCGVEFAATLAACIAQGDPDPAECDAANGPRMVAVDLQDQGLGNQPVYTYLHFQAASLGMANDGATLTLVATSDSWAASDHSGTVWRTQPFDYPDLFVTPPAVIGTQPIAEDLGPVAIGQAVSWWLPPSALGSGGDLYLVIRATSADGVLYWAHDGDFPPTLAVHCASR